MNLAVKFYKQCQENIKGIPDVWPWLCVEIHEDSDYSKESGPWLILSKEEYDIYYTSRLGVYEQYEQNPLLDGVYKPILENEVTQKVDAFVNSL